MSTAANHILFVHGFPFHGGMWRAQLDGLPAGWHGLAPDLRGFGSAPAGAGAGLAADWTMDTFADDMAALLDGHGIERAVVCGLSMGGYISFAFWRRHGDRVRALVLADTRAGADTAEGRASRHAMAEEVVERGTEVVARAMLPKLFAPSTRREKPEVVERVRSMIEGTAPATVAAAQRAMAARPDSTPDLPGIVVPTLVVAGEQDALTGPDEARSMAHALPAARLELIPDAGHMSPMERPEAFNAVLGDWLGSLPAGG